METIRCGECGREFREDELLKFGDSMVCADCKPIFVQRLREGIALVEERVYAGFWIRAGAKIIDGIILGVINFVVGFGGAFIVRHPLASTFFQSGLTIVLDIGYVVYFLGKYSATPGKMACSLKVLRPDGEKIGYGRACGRALAEWLSGIILGIGYIMAAFDEEKRALHDRICDTRVIKG